MTSSTNRKYMMYRKRRQIATSSTKNYIQLNNCGLLTLVEAGSLGGAVRAPAVWGASEDLSRLRIPRA